MPKTIFITVIIFILSVAFTSLGFAKTATPTAIPQAPSTPIQSYETAKVVSILAQGEKTVGAQKLPFQKLQLQILDESDKGKTLMFTYGDLVSIKTSQEVSQGQVIVLLKSVTPQQTTYNIADDYRLSNLYPLAILFLVIVLLVTRFKGLGAIVGLGISLSVIIAFVIPQLLAGQDPLLTSIIGAMFIMVATMYLAHGFSHKTNIALIATSLSLVLTGVLSYEAIHFTFLTGLGSGDASNLLIGPASNIDFQGLFLGGIIIGSLGVLEDITTGLAISIQELSLVNSKLTFRELFDSGLRIGSEHVAALVNTIVLAYAGVGLPILLFMVLNPNHEPLWVMLNSEIIMEEMVRTLAGSIGLVLAVPMTALFAAWAFKQKSY